MEDITYLLERIKEGDSAAQVNLLTALYTELHGLAKMQMRRQPSAHTLQPTALVNEAWMRLERAKGNSFTSRAHFLGYASRAMRSVLLDHARRLDADIRRPVGKKVSFDGVFASFSERAVDLEALDLALNDLEEIDAVMARAVELRFFGGVSMDEVAAILEIPPRSLDRRWKSTKAWLKQRVE